MNKHSLVLKSVFSNISYLVLSLIIFVSMFVLLLHAHGFLFFEPFFIFSIQENMMLSFISILTVSLLTSIVTCISIFQIRMIRANSKKISVGLFGSVVGAGSGICTSCSTVGFSIATSLGIVGTTTLSFLSNYEMPIRIAVICLLLITYFSMVGKIASNCKIPTQKNDQ